MVADAAAFAADVTHPCVANTVAGADSDADNAPAPSFCKILLIPAFPPDTPASTLTCKPNPPLDS